MFFTTIVTWCVPGRHRPCRSSTRNLRVDFPGQLVRNGLAVEEHQRIGFRRHQRARCRLDAKGFARYPVEDEAEVADRLGHNELGGVLQFGHVVAGLHVQLPPVQHEEVTVLGHEMPRSFVQLDAVRRAQFDAVRLGHGLARVDHDQARPGGGRTPTAESNRPCTASWPCAGSFSPVSASHVSGPAQGLPARPASLPLGRRCSQRKNRSCSFLASVQVAHVGGIVQHDVGG